MCSDTETKSVVDIENEVRRLWVCMCGDVSHVKCRSMSTSSRYLYGKKLGACLGTCECRCKREGNDMPCRGCKAHVVCCEPENVGQETVQRTRELNTMQMSCLKEIIGTWTP